jgi:hypothetical protein
MDLNRRSVEELEQQIEKQKADLDRRLEAIRLVREMLAEAAPEAAVAPPVDAAQTEPPPQERAADDGPTLIESVEDLLKRENRAWTVPQVYDALRSKNFQFGSKTPKGTIGTALIRLVERELAVVVKKGSGRRPHQYKARRWAPPSWLGPDDRVVAPGIEELPKM